MGPYKIRIVCYVFDIGQRELFSFITIAWKFNLITLEKTQFGEIRKIILII